MKTLLEFICTVIVIALVGLSLLILKSTFYTDGVYGVF